MSFVKPTIRAWSYSRMKTWEECPAKAKFKFIDRLQEPDSPYAARGTEIHSIIESYIKGELMGVPPQIADVIEYIDELRHADTQTEMQVSFNDKWEPVDWFSIHTYCRVIFDAARKDGDSVIVVDHKTGKKYDEHTDQLRLYALAAFKLWPDTKKVYAQIIYVDHGERLRMEFDKSVEGQLQEYWDERAGKLRADDIFSPRPNSKCKWCHFRKSNGGPCVFS